MGAPLISRDEMLNRLTRVFRENGFGASLSQLSKETGLGRASLYHYFPEGKAAMAAAVIERSNAQLEREIIGPLRRRGSPRARLAAMMDSLDRYFSGGKESCLLGALSLAGPNTVFARHIEAGFRAWIDAVAEVLKEAGLGRDARSRAQDAVFSIEGALLVGRAMGDVSPFRRLLRELPSRLVSK